MNNKLNQNLKGMNLDSLTSQVGEGEVTWALNANVQSFDGSRFAYTNELGNQFCTQFKSGFVVVGQPYYIIEQDIIIFALYNPNTGESEIGQVTAFNKDCLKLISKEKDCGCEKGSVLEDEVVEQLNTRVVEDCETILCYEVEFFPFNEEDYDTCTPQIGKPTFGGFVEYVDCTGKPAEIFYSCGTRIFTSEPYNLKYFTRSGYPSVKTYVTTDFYRNGTVRPSVGTSKRQLKDPNCKQKIVTECCQYKTIVSNPCLNFSEDYPVWFKHKALPCDTYLYFVSKNNPPRRISLSAPEGVDACGNPVKVLDCNEIDIFPKTCHPDILPTIIDGNGQLKAGSYRFTLAYTDQYGNELTDYFDLTSEVPIFERPITVDTDYITNKSISMIITHHTDVFDYFNLVVQQTANTVSTYYLVGTYRVAAPQTYTFNGINAKEFTAIKTLNRTPRYETAGIIEDSDDILFLADLEGDIDYNIQPLANEIKLYWETVEMPADKDKFNYHNGIIVSNFRGYMRDEIYGFGIKFKLKTGKYTKVYHIPGRKIEGPDAALLNPDEYDVFSAETNCDPPNKIPTWKVYNTATKFSTPKKCNAVGDLKQKEFSCEITPYHSQGEFAYWESTLKYPCNEAIWGSLADQPIRFHKFPDCAITHIHNNVNLQSPPPGGQKIYPIGVRPDIDVLNDLINTFKIYNPKTGKNDLLLKDIICGFELVRTTRSTGKSVIAKGLAYDVAYAEDRSELRNGGSLKSYYYANYPYNDLNPDYFLSTSDEIYESPDPNDGTEARLRQVPFNNTGYLRYTFHSPDTHFQFPQLGTELKLESVETGNWRGRFAQVQEHPRYKFLTKFDFALCSLLGTALSYVTKNDSTTTNSTTQGLLSTATSPPSITYVALINNGANQSGGSDVNFAEILTNTELLRDTLERLIPELNYAYTFQSKADYTWAWFPTRNIKSTRRLLDTAVYLSPDNQFVPLGNGQTEQVNNNQRESSVYLKVNTSFSFPFNVPISDNSRRTIGQKKDDGLYPIWCSNPETEQTGDVKANYMSIKRTIPNQYGTIDNLIYVSTGDFYELQFDQFQTYVKCKYYPTFGGDIFINRFALKRKMPFFTQNMVGRPDGINFDYQLVPNILYPTYYIGTSPDSLSVSEIFDPTTLAFVGVGVAGLIAGSLLPEGNSAKIANTVGYASLGVGVANLLANLSGGFIPKNNLDSCITPSKYASDKVLEITLDPPKVSSALFNLAAGNPFYQEGKFYLSAYGIPNFFVESEINVDMRHGRNSDEENFFPNVGTGLSSFGDWLQEYRVPIRYDNFYWYNATYSKQNFENFNKPYDSFEPDELCSSVFPNRVIYSDGFTQEESKDSWLVYRTNNYYDFPKTNGKLIALNQVENNKMLARFENTTQAYNARIIIDSTYPTQLELGTGNMFSTKPIEYVRADLGYVGSQHKAYISCKYGSFWTDAKRGFVYQLSGSSGFDEITKNNFNWFKRNLPFRIIEDFPDFPIDNSFKDVGIAMAWDERFERVFITKRDYKVVERYRPFISYNDGIFTYVELDTIRVIELDDPTFFEDKSWTVAYSPLTKGWLSFYSFLPNYYVGLTDHFQSGIKITTGGVKQSTLWNHLISPLRYQTYYNKLEPYVVEYSVDTLPNVSTVNSVTLFQDIQKFYNKTDFYSLGSSNSTNKVNFNKAILYNKEQCSGMLYLIPENPNDMSQRTRYPRVQSDHIEILYSHREQKFTFNSFWDTVNWTSNNQPIFVTDWDILQNSYYTDKVLNRDAIIYQSRQGKQMPLRSTHCRVRLIQDVHSRFRFINTLQNTQLNPSRI